MAGPTGASAALDRMRRPPAKSPPVSSGSARVLFLSRGGRLAEAGGRFERQPYEPGVWLKSRGVAGRRPARLKKGRPDRRNAVRDGHRGLDARPLTRACRAPPDGHVRRNGCGQARSPFVASGRNGTLRTARSQDPAPRDERAGGQPSCLGGGARRARRERRAPGQQGTTRRGPRADAPSMVTTELERHLAARRTGRAVLRLRRHAKTPRFLRASLWRPRRGPSRRAGRARMRVPVGLKATVVRAPRKPPAQRALSSADPTSRAIESAPPETASRTAEPSGISPSPAPRSSASRRESISLWYDGC